MILIRCAIPGTNPPRINKKTSLAHTTHIKVLLTVLPWEMHREYNIPDFSLRHSGTKEDDMVSCNFLFVVCCCCLVLLLLPLLSLKSRSRAGAGQSDRLSSSWRNRSGDKMIEERNAVAVFVHWWDSARGTQCLEGSPVAIDEHRMDGWIDSALDGSVCVSGRKY